MAELLLARTREIRDNGPGNDMAEGRVSGMAEFLRMGQLGDEKALEAIYGRLKGPLFGLAYRYTSNVTIAEDLLQDIFLKIFAHLRDVDRPETFEAWAYRIALNHCYSYLREKRTSSAKTIPLSSIEGTLAETKDGEGPCDARKPLEEAIARLPEGLRTVFILHDVQGFKHEEISRKLGCSVGTSKSQLFKARMRIREDLQRKRAV